MMIIFNLIVGLALLDEVLYIDNCQWMKKGREDRRRKATFGHFFNNSRGF